MMKIENISIRRLGSPEGVVQVYRCWSLETPIGDDSFSLIGESASPSEIDPATVWEQKDYLRLIQFLEVNSAMVNVRGHVIVRSLVKSRRVGRPDGPAAYWRCLDVLPMHAFGLVRPVDTHGTPQFLIIGGDLSLSTPGKVIDAEDWKAKYNNLDAEFKKLKYELDFLKATVGGVNDVSLSNCQSENKRLVSEIEDQKSTYQQIQATLKNVEVERDSLKVSLALSDKEFFACQIENNRLVDEIKDSSKKFETLIKSTEVERDSLKANLAALNDTLTACQSENTKLVQANEDQRSVNEQFQAILMDIEAERDSLRVSLDLSDKKLSACQMENKNLVTELNDSSENSLTQIKSIVVERDSLKASLIACQTENKNSVDKHNKLYIDYKELGALARDLIRERDSLEEELEKLRG